MSKTFIDKACAVVPNLENRISLFHKKLSLVQYAEQSIYDYKVMGLKQPRGLVLPKVRKPKKLPRVLSQRSMARLIHCCGLYDKTLLALTYDCALRVSEKCAGSDGKISVLTDRCSSSAKVRATRTAMCPSPRRCSLC